MHIHIKVLKTQFKNQIQQKVKCVTFLETRSENEIPFRRLFGTVLL